MPSTKFVSTFAYTDSRIHWRERGWAFSPNNFVENFSRDQAENVLAGLRREVKIALGAVVP